MQLRHIQLLIDALNAECNRNTHPLTRQQVQWEEDHARLQRFNASKARDAKRLKAMDAAKRGR